MTELKPCPFCGGEAAIYAAIYVVDSYYVVCCRCEAQTARYRTTQEAVVAWNRRPTFEDDSYMEGVKYTIRVKIRKNHICQGCGKKLVKGEMATESSYAGYGRVWTFYECQECAEWREKHCRKCPDRGACIEENYYVGLLAECKREEEDVK